MDALVIVVEIAGGGVGRLGRQHRRDRVQLRVGVRDVFTVVEAMVREVGPAADRGEGRKSPVAAEVGATVGSHACAGAPERTIISPPIWKGLPLTVADAGRELAVRQRTLEEQFVGGIIPRGRRNAGGPQAEKRQAGDALRVQRGGEVPGLREKRKVLAQAARGRVGEQTLGVEAHIVIELRGIGRVIDRREVRRAEGLRAFGPQQGVGAGRGQGHRRSQHAHLLVLAADPPGEIALGAVGRRRGRAAIDEGDRLDVDLADGFDIGRRAHQRHRIRGGHDRRGSRRLGGGPGRGHESRVTIAHLTGDHPAQETVSLPGGIGRVEDAELGAIIRLFRTTCVTAVRADVVIEAFPAPPDAQHRVIERVCARGSLRGNCGVFVNGGVGGDAGIGTDPLLQGGAGETDGGQGVEAGDRLSLLRGGQRRLHFDEGSQHHDDHHHHGHDQEGNHQGKSLA